MRTTNLAETEVVALMRDGRRLMLMHNGTGTKSWYLVPGGEIADDVAHAVLAREYVHGIRDTLWPGIPQIFAYRRSA